MDRQPTNAHRAAAQWQPVNDDLVLSATGQDLFKRNFEMLKAGWNGTLDQLEAHLQNEYQGGLR